MSALGKILFGKIPAGQVIVLQVNPTEVFHLVAGGGVQLFPGKVRIFEVRSCDNCIGQIGVGQRGILKVRIGKILPRKVPAGQVIVS